MIYVVLGLETRKFDNFLSPNQIWKARQLLESFMFNTSESLHALLTSARLILSGSSCEAVLCLCGGWLQSGGP